MRARERYPAMFYLEEADGGLELRVEDGHGTGRPEVVRSFLEHLRAKMEFKQFDQLGVGSSYEY